MLSPFTFAQGSAVVHALVVVLVDGAEVGVVVVAQRVPSVPTVVGEEELVAVQLVAHGEKAILSVARLSLPVLRWGNVNDLERLAYGAEWRS